MKLLIIEDEIPLCQSIAEYLSSSYVCEQAYNYTAALEKIKEHDYDCIILDIMLPGGSGLQLLDFLKKMRKDEAVIIISAKNSIDDKVYGLEAGADDYLSKPFHLSELNARVSALLRRKVFEGQSQLVAGDISVHLAGKNVTVNGNTISLTAKEYQLLLYLIANRNKVLSKNNIATHLWGDDIDYLDNHDFIYTHIKNLRKKIIAAGGEDCIRSVYGVGYKMQVL